MHTAWWMGEVSWATVMTQVTSRSRVRVVMTLQYTMAINQHQHQHQAGAGMVKSPSITSLGHDHNELHSVSRVK